MLNVLLRDNLRLHLVHVILRLQLNFLRFHNLVPDRLIVRILLVSQHRLIKRAHLVLVLNRVKVVDVAVIV